MFWIMAAAAGRFAVQGLIVGVANVLAKKAGDYVKKMNKNE